MDYEKIVRTIVDPFIENPDALMIRVMPSGERNVTVLIVSEGKDTARLIGRRGMIANALREVVGVAGKNENKRVRLKFESFDEEEEGENLEEPDKADEDE